VIVHAAGHRDGHCAFWQLGRQALRRVYIAMIGSKRKVISVVKELEKRRHSAGPRLERIFAPMGFDVGRYLAGGDLQSPFAAEMIAMRRNPAGNWRPASRNRFSWNEHLRARLK